jgi:hypothetical protein
MGYAALTILNPWEIQTLIDTFTTQLAYAATAQTSQT